MHQPALATTVGSNTYDQLQMHAQIKHSLAYLQDLTPILACIRVYKLIH